MASIETTPHLEGNAGATPADGEKTAGWKPSAIAGDIATLGVGTALAAVFNTLLVFLIPRLTTVEEFGYWRLFLLYAGYVGFLHFGFADGALLTWAGRPLEDFRHEIGPSLKFLFWLQLALIVPGAALAALLLRWPLSLVGVAVLIFSLIFNSAAVLQFGLQGARIFRPVAIATAAPSCGFVVMTLLWHLRGTPNFQGLIGLYCASWAGVLAYLWTRIGRMPSAYPRGAAWTLGKTYIALGWPIVLANGGLVLVQSADRLVGSAVLPIFEFAQYSLAASTMFVPAAAILAVSRVFFSHVAAVEHEGRAKVYGHASKFLLMAWSLLLPYYFVLEVVVRHFLPKYVPALPAARILLLGVIFLAGIQILHMSFANLYGRQREFLFLTVGALVVTFSVVLAMALWLRSLVAVAIGQVGALALWWVANEWNLRETTGHRLKDRLRLMIVFAWSAISYGTAMKFAGSVGGRTLVYYALVVGCLAFTCYPEIRITWNLLSRGVPRAVIYGTRG
jgi:O-antigen/teichoic acid export membrane protein